MLTSLERSCSDPYWHLLGEKYPCCRYSKLVVLTSTCPYNVKLHCKTLPCLGKWLRYPRVPKSVLLFRLAALQQQVCLWWGDLSTTLLPLMHSSHMYHARDGHQQWWDVLVCLGALTQCDLLIPNTIPPAQSKAFWHLFLTSGTSMFWKEERICSWVRIILQLEWAWNWRSIFFTCFGQKRTSLWEI